MKKILVNGLKFFGMHIFMVILSFLLSTILGYVGGMVTFSVIMSILYIGTMVGMGYDCGHNDLSPFDGIKPSLKRALLASLVPGAIGIVLLIVVATGGVGNVAKVWFVMFIGFFKYKEYARVIEVLPMTLVLPVSVLVGYWFGMKNISVFDNMDRKIKERAKEKQQKQEKEHQRRVELERQKRQ